jgi:TolB-like protein/tRNA A-37 threonylcarbamoyl transferase component Bud32/tetratricopeptide (TPR) repeat protein
MSLRDQLQAALGNAFTLDRELTGGGMSRVFLATETALGRRVVVKVLHPELAAEVTQERFAREIMMVAKLQQANIVPLITTGHTGEVPFYTMPFVEGHSLRQRISEQRQFSVPEVIGVLRDVARALAYAHDAGVVHRDIKPENILLSGGAAVVTDFGIAKAISASRTQPGAITITQAGSGIGTPAYMAPEQAAGDPTVDHRADIYAFGCLAYELLCGKPPFDEPSIHEIIAAHMTKTPVELKTKRHDTPSGLAQLVMHCLSKQPGQRPQSARELLDSLDALITPVRASAAANRLREPKNMLRLMLGAIVVSLVLVFAFAKLKAPAGGASDASLAVIPFVNVGGDSAQDYLADGVSDELATAIGKLPGVHVSARSAAYRFRGRRDVDVRVIGESLGVKFVVQGTLRRVGDQLRVSAQLIEATSRREMWSDNFDRAANDVFQTQDSITAAIGRALNPRGIASSPAKATAIVGLGTSDVEAYDLYMRGEFALRQRQIVLASDFFQRAIARDAKFARAYAGLSQALALTPYFTTTSSAAVFDRLVLAANTALARDSSLAEAWMSLGLAYMHSWRWEEAGRHFDRAIAADRSDPQSHFQRGRYFLYRGMRDSAVAEWAQTKLLDPFSALASSWTAYVLSLQGRTDQALTEAALAIQFDSIAAVVRLNVVRVYTNARRVDEALRSADLLPQLPMWRANRAYAYAALGRADTARAFVKQMEALPASTWQRNGSLAYAYLALRDTTRALEALERATDAVEMWPNFFPVHDPLFDPVRHSARWAALLKRVGLDKASGALP